MTADQTITFLLFAIVAAITPGPSNLILTSTGATVGVLRGLPCLGGVVTGMGLMIFLAAIGLGGLVLASPVLFSILRWGGIGVLLWLSWKIATAGRSNATSAQQPLGFWGAAGFQWVNPKSWLVSVSAVSTYLYPESHHTFAQAAGLSLLFIAAALPSCFIWLAFGASVQRFLRAERTARLFHVAMGVLLAGAVLLFIW